MNAPDPIESALHRALQQRRTRQAGEAPPFQAMRECAQATVSVELQDSAGRPGIRFWALGKWLLPLAAALALMGVVFQNHRAAEPPPSLAALVGEIADEHERSTHAAFGRWTAPSEQLLPTLNLEL